MAGFVDTLPEGFVIDPLEATLPEGFALDPVAGEEPAPVEEPGFLERVGERLGKRAETFQELTAAPPESTGESLGKGFQLLGNVVAGGVLDVAGEVVSTGFDAVVSVAEAITPDDVEDSVKETVGDIFNSVVGTDIAQAGISAAGQGIEAYQKWAAENPEAAKNVDAAANLALVAIPVKGKPKVQGPVQPGIAGRAAERVGQAATTQVATQRTEFLTELVRPFGTKKVKEAEALRTTPGRGLLGPSTVSPSAAEVRIAGAVDRVEGVKASNTIQQNLNAVQTGLSREADSLATTLKGSTVKIARPEINKTMDAVVKTLEANPLLVGDAAKTGVRVLDKARSILKANKNTPAGVLKARKEFDAWVGSQRPKIFDPATDSALSIAVRETRQAMNGIIEKSVPNIAVRDSLAMQSNLFNALDNIAPKAAREASTKLGRLATNVSEVLGAKGGLDAKVRTALGMAVFTGSAATAGVKTTAIVAGTALATIGTKRAIQAVSTKKAIRKLLQQTDKAIQAAKRNANTDMLKKLRLDRAAAVEILKNIQGDK